MILLRRYKVCITFQIKKYGLGEALIPFIESYIKNRTVYVKHKNFVSNPFCSGFGKLQGSHLSTLLFIIFINDIYLVIKSCKLLLFVDKNSTE